MLDPNKTGEQQQAADAAGQQQQAGVKADAAGQVDSVTEKEKGLLAAKEAETKKRQEAEQTVAYYQQLLQNIQIAQANKPQVQQQQQQAGQQDLLSQFNIGDEDYVQGSVLRQFLQAIQRQVGTAIQSTVSAMGIQQAVQEHPDYSQVIGTTDLIGNFIPSQHLTKVLQKKPYLANALRRLVGTPEGIKLAYDSVISDSDYQQFIKMQALTPAQQLNAQTAAKIQQQQPLSASAAAGGGQIDKNAAIAAMTDEQLRVHRQQRASQT